MPRQRQYPLDKKPLEVLEAASPRTVGDAPNPSSKTQKKREADYLQKMAALVSTWKAKDWADSGFEEESIPAWLLQAIEEMRTIRSHEGKRRHLQFLGKLMRQWQQEDAQCVGRLQAAIANKNRIHLQDNHIELASKMWRDRLLKRYDSRDHRATRDHARHCEHFMNLYPHTTPEQQRRLEQYREEVMHGSKHAEREFFREVKAIITQSSSLVTTFAND